MITDATATDSEAVKNFIDDFRKTWDDNYKAFMESKGTVNGTQTENTVDNGKSEVYSKRSETENKYKKKKTPYDEFNSNVMQWSNSTGTQEGDTKVFCKKAGEFVLLEADGNGGFVELARGNYKKVSAVYERLHREKTESFYGDVVTLRTEQGGDFRNNIDDENGKNDVGYSGQARSKVSESDTSGNNEHNRTGDKGKSVKYSLRDSDANKLSENQIEYFKDGTEPVVSDVSRFRYSRRGTAEEFLSTENRAKPNSASSINWVYKAEIFSVTENKMFHQKIGEINQGSEAFEQNADGEYMLPIENKIVFTDGNYDAPYISRIIEVMTNSGTRFEYVRREIYSVEQGRQGLQETGEFIEAVFGKGCVNTYKSYSDQVYEWTNGKRKGKNRRAVIERYQRLQNRRGNDTEGRGTESVKFSERVFDDQGFTHRELLRNALSTVAQNDTERDFLARYQREIKDVEKKYEEVAKLRRQIHDISFTKGSDRSQLSAIKNRVAILEDQIQRTDKKLLQLEATKVLKDVVEREKKTAVKKANERNKQTFERYKSRKRSSEVREKIKSLHKDLVKSLLYPTDKNYIPPYLVKSMVDVCNAIDFSTDRTGPDGGKTKAQERREKIKSSLNKLKNEYEKLKKDNDPNYRSEYDEAMSEELTQLIDMVSNSRVSDMTETQLQAVYQSLKTIQGTLRGAKTVKYSLEATVRRDTLTAVHKLANQSSEVMCDEVGTDYVEISSHLGARVHPTNKVANHAGWQGKVFKIHGEDPEYPNLKESTGYPGDILGLGGVNCRHRMFPFVPGISTPNPINFSEEENRKAYELSQQQRKLERDMRKLKKKKAAAKASGDKEKAKELKKKITAKSKEIDEFCEKNNLRRDHSRELVTEQIKKKVAKAEDSVETQKFKKANKTVTSQETQKIEKSENSDIIESGSDDVSEFKMLGKIETQPLEEEFGKLMTDEIIVTNERIDHIKERHPEDYELFELHGRDTVNNPDIIIKDSKNSETVFMIKQLEDTNLNVVAKLILETGNPNHKNSVMTFYRIRNRNLKKLLDKNKTLYKKE